MASAENQRSVVLLSQAAAPLSNAVEAELLRHNIRVERDYRFASLDRKRIHRVLSTLIPDDHLSISTLSSFCVGEKAGLLALVVSSSDPSINVVEKAAFLKTRLTMVVERAALATLKQEEGGLGTRHLREEELTRAGITTALLADTLAKTRITAPGSKVGNTLSHATLAALVEPEAVQKGTVRLSSKPLHTLVPATASQVSDLLEALGKYTSIAQAEANAAKERREEEGAASGDATALGATAAAAAERDGEDEEEQEEDAELGSAAASAHLLPPSPSKPVPTAKQMYPNPHSSTAVTRPKPTLLEAVDLDQLKAFVFPRDELHPKSSGRLVLVALYGPLTHDGQLVGGRGTGRALSTRELSTMIDEVERGDILSVFDQEYAKKKGKAESEVLYSSPKRGPGDGYKGDTRQLEVEVHAESLKSYPNITPQQLDAMLIDLPRDDLGRVSFHDLQTRILEARDSRIMAMKEMFPKVMTSGGPTAAASMVRKSFRPPKELLGKGAVRTRMAASVVAATASGEGSFGGTAAEMIPALRETTGGGGSGNKLGLSTKDIAATLARSRSGSGAGRASGASAAVATTTTSAHDLPATLINLATTGALQPSSLARFSGTATSNGAASAGAGAGATRPSAAAADSVDGRGHFHPKMTALEARRMRDTSLHKQTHTLMPLEALHSAANVAASDKASAIYLLRSSSSASSASASSSVAEAAKPAFDNLAPLKRHPNAGSGVPGIAGRL